MKDSKIENKVKRATKWSFVSEIVSKLIAPITNMILARLLTPEMFGVVATVTMITTFADIFTNAGFQQYLIRTDFEDNCELEIYANTAFWSNFTISILLYVLIAFFRHPLAVQVGNPGLGNAFMIACLSFPLTSFSSIQVALFQRKFDFKSLFYARLIGALVPLLVTVPIAFITHSYWAMIIGSVCVQLANTVVLTILSPWKPHLVFHFWILKKMYSFGIGAFVEQLLGWLNLNIGVFIVGTFLSEYYLGIYKTAMGTVNQLMTLVVAAVSPILLTTLSRLQNDNEMYQSFFYRFERLVGLIVLPMGVGMFLYDSLITKLFLGSQWDEAAAFLGVWALSRAISIVFGMFGLQIALSKGKPSYSVFAQIVDLILLIVILGWAAPQGFTMLYRARCVVCLIGIVPNVFILKKLAGISTFKIISELTPVFFAIGIMAVLAVLLQQINKSILWSFLTIVISIFTYGGILLLIPKSKKDIIEIINPILKRRGIIKKKHN